MHYLPSFILSVYFLKHISATQPTQPPPLRKFSDLFTANIHPIRVQIKSEDNAPKLRATASPFTPYKVEERTSDTIHKAEDAHKLFATERNQQRMIHGDDAQMKTYAQQYTPTSENSRSQKSTFDTQTIQQEAPPDDTGDHGADKAPQALRCDELQAECRQMQWDIKEIKALEDLSTNVEIALQTINVAEKYVRFFPGNYNNLFHSEHGLNTDHF